jgi:hypothetical protein
VLFAAWVLSASTVPAALKRERDGWVEIEEGAEVMTLDVQIPKAS